MNQTPNKINLKNRTRDKFGIITLSPNSGCELLLCGEDITDFIFESDSEIELYNKYTKILSGINDDDSPLIIYNTPTCTIEEFDRDIQSHWFTPEPFASADVEEVLLKLCSTEKERNRVKEEMVLFQQYELNQMLRCLLWLVSTMRENGIVWGVGRGSSCASYCLYLMGIHRVNSLQYNLDFREFLK